MVREPRSPALMHLRDHPRAAQRTADSAGLVPHVLVRFLRPEDRFAIPDGGADTPTDRLRVFARERENVSQEGFDALVHGSPVASPRPTIAHREAGCVSGVADPL
jgi:hypothetical protein